jgi:hypothetical protein
MQSQVVALGSHDHKANEHMKQSLGICAHDHILSRKLFQQCASALGPKFAIVGDWLDLEKLPTYDEGEQPPADSPDYAQGEYPQDRLIAFVREYLLSVDSGIVVSENWGAKREHAGQLRQLGRRVVWYGDTDVYHIVTKEMIDDDDAIEAAVVAAHHWQTSVCSSCTSAPPDEIQDEAFIDEIVRNTRHIFIPAFDGTGYLIWSLERSTGQRQAGTT